MSAPYGPALRDFRRPWLWLGLWLLAIVAVVVLSLTPPPAVSVPRGFDKVEHMTAYFLLSAGAVQLFESRSAQVKAAIALIALGMGLEFAQMLLTRTRMADPADALANVLGVAAGQLIALTPFSLALQRLDRRLR